MSTFRPDDDRSTEVRERGKSLKKSYLKSLKIPKSQNALKMPQIVTKSVNFAKNLRKLNIQAMMQILEEIFCQFFESLQDHVSPPNLADSYGI